MSDFLRTVAKYSDAQPRWPEGTPIDPSTGAGGGRWRDDDAPHVGASNILEGYSEHAHLNERGWIVTSSVDDAVRALNEGKHVELMQVREVSTLLDRLAAIALAAEELGEKAPVYDLCKVSVRGTNLFCADAFDIERDKMPQFLAFPRPGSEADKLPRRKRGTVDAAPAFVEHLQRNGYTVTHTEESAAYLRASQRQLNGAKVGQMIRRWREPNNPFNDAPPMIISEDNYIIDGHHRWAAYVGIDSEDGSLGDVKIPVIRVNIRVLKLLEEANAFTEAFGMTRSVMQEKMRKAWLDVVKTWNEAQHPRGKTTPESTPGSFAPAGAALSGNRPVVIETFEYRRPGIRHQTKIDVLFNPTATDLKRWAGRDIKQVRWIKWGDDVAMWNAYESTHQQVADALIKERTATEADFEDAYWNLSAGFNNGPNVMSGDVTLSEILSAQGRKLYDDVLKPEVRKSWLGVLARVFKEAAGWVEADHPRGKTTEGTNAGSFRPSDKNSPQKDMFGLGGAQQDWVGHTTGEIARVSYTASMQAAQERFEALLAEAADKDLTLESTQQLAQAATEVARAKAFALASEAALEGRWGDLPPELQGLSVLDAATLRDETLAPMAEQYIFTVVRDSLLWQSDLDIELSEHVRQDLAYGDSRLSRDNYEWASALDAYIGNSYDEINGVLRGETPDSTPDHDSPQWQSSFDQYYEENEETVLNDARTAFLEAAQDTIDEGVAEALSDDADVEELNRQLAENEITQEEFNQRLDERTQELRMGVEDETLSYFENSTEYEEAVEKLKESATTHADTVWEEEGHGLAVYEEQAAAIQTLINSRPETPVSLLLYRGVRSGASIDWNYLNAGDVIDLAGFTSTSSKKQVAEDWKRGRVIEFVVPAGSKDVLFTTNDREGEVLLNHATQATVLARTDQRLVVYFNPMGDADDRRTSSDNEVVPRELDMLELLPPSPEPVAKRFGRRWKINFGRLGADPVLVSEVVKWDESEHPRGKTTPESNKGSFTDRGSTGFVSPNIDENVSFDEATSRQSSERTRLLQSAAQEAAQFFGVTAHDQVGVGAWADGAEQSLIVSGEGDPEDFKAYMAFLGLVSEQKAVVDFTNDSSGPDAVFRMSVGNRPLKTVHEMLLKAGVQFHTLRQSDHNVDVFVFAPGMEQETTDAVARAAQEFGVGVTAIRGRGEFVGSWDTREEGRARYEEILDAHGRRVHGHDRGWQALRSRWWGRLQAVRKSWLQVVKDWDESKHPRGKTTPESNAGSFTPADMEVGDIDLSAPKPAKEFYVWRVGDPADGLVGRNAGTLEGVLAYLDDADEELIGTAPTAVKFKVSLDADMAWGGYEHRSGDFESLSEKAARKRGIAIAPRIGRNERGWLSFPRTGFTATAVEVVPVGALRQRVRKSWLQIVKEAVWREEEHPRGKTTSESNEGSFAPSSGRRSLRQTRREGATHDLTSSSWGDGEVRRIKVRAPIGASNTVQVIKNPTERDMQRFGERLHVYRYSIDFDSGNYLVWDAQDAIHYQVDKATGVLSMGGSISNNSENPIPASMVYQAIRQQVARALERGHISDDQYDAVMEKLGRVSKSVWLITLLKWGKTADMYEDSTGTPTTEGVCEAARTPSPAPSKDSVSEVAKTILGDLMP